MKLMELLLEKKVQSTWIADLSFNRPKLLLTMTLSNGKKFAVHGISRSIFEKWTNAPSKGTYFHEYISGNHKIVRTR